MLTVLALDTATEFCSVALARGGQLQDQHLEMPRAHNRHILRMIDDVLGDNALSEIDLIACGVGPGSFTGLRIGCSVTQGLAWSLDLPVYGQCSLALQALSARLASDSHFQSGDWILSTIDAQINQLYWRWFRCGDDALEAMSEPMISPASSIVGFPDEGRIAVIGSGCRYQDALQASFPRTVHWQPTARPRAGVIAQALQTATLDELPIMAATALLPRYVQQDIGWKKIAEQGPRG